MINLKRQCGYASTSKDRYMGPTSTTTVVVMVTSQDTKMKSEKQR